MPALHVVQCAERAASEEQHASTTGWLTCSVARHQVVPHVQPELEVPGAVAKMDLPASQVQAVLYVLIPDGRAGTVFRQVTESDQHAVHHGCCNQCALPVEYQAGLHPK